MFRKGELFVQNINEKNFKELGQIIRIPVEKGKKPDFESEIIRFYGKLGLINANRPFELGICIFKRRSFIVEKLEHHINTQELLYAIDDDFIMPVAPTLDNVPDLDNIVAVRVNRSEGVVFERGIWHWVPYPLKDESFALVGFAKDTTENDLEIYTLDEKIRMIER